MIKREKIYFLLLTIGIIAVLIKDFGIYELDYDTILKGSVVATLCILFLQPDDKMLSAIVKTIVIGIIWELIFENAAIILGLWYLPITIELTYYGFCLGFLFVGVIAIPEKFNFTRNKSIVWKLTIVSLGSILGAMGDYYLWDYEPSVSIIVTYLYWLLSWVVLLVAFHFFYHKNVTINSNIEENK